MDKNRVLCLCVSYYLSRFNEEAYRNLEFRTQLEAHNEIGRLLNVNPHTVKNNRDQFDPIHGFRVGWYQAPLSPSRAKIVESLQSLNEFELRTIVKDILEYNVNDSSTNIENLISSVNENSIEGDPKKFILRGPTGRKAEEFFMAHFAANFLPLRGELTDCRELGTGYDFKITGNQQEVYIEVKGLSNIDGGIMFTSKEWEMAEKHRERFFVVLVSNIEDIPEINFINDPFGVFSPKKNIIKTVQVNWSISKKAIRESDSRMDR